MCPGSRASRGSESRPARTESSSSLSTTPRTSTSRPPSPGCAAAAPRSPARATASFTSPLRNADRTRDPNPTDHWRSMMPRPTVIVALPPDERAVVCGVLQEAGFPTAIVSGPADVFELLASGVPLGAAIVDAETDLSTAVAIDDELHAGGRAVPTLVIASDGQLDNLSHIAGAAGSEFVLRPYSAESLRWRIEAMVIRAQVADVAAETTDAVFFGGGVQVQWTSSAPIIVVF